jgi:hypothetical protein
MFGKEPIYSAIRQNPALNAKEILTGIFLMPLTGF